MIEKEVVVTSSHGLHARPAALLVQEAGKFRSTIHIIKDGKEADAKSLLGVMSLAIKQGEKILLRIEGEDERQAADKITLFFDQLKET